MLLLSNTLAALQAFFFACGGLVLVTTGWVYALVRIRWENAQGGRALGPWQHVACALAGLGAGLSVYGVALAVR